MTVKELIKLLQKYHTRLRVVVNKDEEDYDNLLPQQISITTTCLNTRDHHWLGWYGVRLFLMKMTIKEEKPSMLWYSVVNAIDEGNPKAEHGRL